MAIANRRLNINIIILGIIYGNIAIIISNINIIIGVKKKAFT